MSAAALASVIAAAAALVTAVAALIHSVQTRAAVTSNSQVLARAATSPTRPGPPGANSSSK